MSVFDEITIKFYHVTEKTALILVFHLNVEFGELC